ncbi:ATP-binding protein [Streptomyces sp. NBC_01092]|uniref:ATP-binding protein n=1 Tax=Streptomyces sp. NBC_01092 TaxID=2903748 RepID=UPI003869D605|nr:tetratricopeptide repeat protein [Streptomyces sp. NBC_01092]
MSGLRRLARLVVVAALGVVLAVTTSQIIADNGLSWAWLYVSLAVAVLAASYSEVLGQSPSSSPTEATAPTAPVVPMLRQLPAPPALFTGRTRELAALSTALEGQGDRGGTVVISAIGGAGGIGKTYLALQWAHDHTERFPDGQLYVNLRGFDPSGEPMAPSVALRGFLDALGVEPAAVPADVEAQVGLYRSLVVGKRILVVLDNARDTAQVVPLLPGSPSCTVVVTSRHQLGGLVTAHVAKPLTLDALSEAEARQLLARHLGEDRLDAAPQAATAILERCAGLPLALSIVAARAALQPDFPLAHLAEELAEAGTRLDALDAGDLNADLRAVFACSYHALEPAAARAFILLGLAPGPDISLRAAASLIGHTVPRARVLLRILEAAHLIRQHTPGRYQLHDLVRLYAAERGHHDLDQPPCTAALRRLADFYLHAAHHASQLLDSHWTVELVLDPPAAGCTPHRVADATAAREWFVAEDACLRAAHQFTHDQGWHTHTWQLPAVLLNFRFLQGHRPEDLRMWRAALVAADQLRDPIAQPMARYGYGIACAHADQYAQAQAYLNQALTLFGHADQLSGQADTHYMLSWTWEQQGNPQQALAHDERALRLHQTLGNIAREARSLNAVGWDHALLGQYEQARSFCEQALALIRTAGDRIIEAANLDSLGYIAHHSGQHHQALDYYQQALTLCRETGDTWSKAGTLEHLGETYHALGRLAETRQAWQQALELFRIQHRTAEAAHVQEHLDALEPTHTDPPGR